MYSKEMPAQARALQPIEAVRIQRGQPEWEQCEQELHPLGRFLPVHARSAASLIEDWRHSSLIALRDAEGRFAGGFAVHRREIPFVVPHYRLQVRRLGASLPGEGAELALDALVAWARADTRILRVNVELFERDVRHREWLAHLLARRGFKPAAEANSYRDTVITDLTRDEEAIFASLHASARRNLRQMSRHPVTIRCITAADSASNRMEALLQQTLDRTGGRHVPRDWTSRIAFAQVNPELARLVGIFRDDLPRSQSLLAFAWGSHHGDHVEYADSASTREPAARGIPLMYPLMWDLITWAKRTGASWFDMGGVTTGTRGDDTDPLGGISDFKRYFSNVVTRVGDEWVLDRHSLKARLASVAYRRLQKR